MSANSRQLKVNSTICAIAHCVFKSNWIDSNATNCVLVVQGMLDYCFAAKWGFLLNQKYGTGIIETDEINWVIRILVVPLNIKLV